MRKSIRHIDPKRNRTLKTAIPTTTCTDLPVHQKFPSISSSSNDHESQLSILQFHMNPSSPFEQDDFLSPTNNDYDNMSTISATATLVTEKNTQKRMNRKARLAGFWNRSSTLDWNSIDTKIEEDTYKSEQLQGTTPLHEAARLGNPALLSLMLQQGGNPNVKNGKQRTALHMVAGGLTGLEAFSIESNHREQPMIGIIAPIINDDHQILDADDEPPIQRATRAMTKLWKNTMRKDKPKEPTLPQQPFPPSHLDQQAQMAARMDTLLTILAWTHPNDESPSSGEGPSINSVDICGRTALHYAGELGRTELCMAVLSSFGAILTIVDEFGSTPCELAGIEGHVKLAAQLEARALLYMDPYGMDDELMIAILTGAQETEFGRMSLTLPFCWFETWNMENVQEERRTRLASAFQGMKEILGRKQKDQEITNEMLRQCMDESMDSSPDVVTVEREKSDDDDKMSADDSSCDDEKSQENANKVQLNQEGDVEYKTMHPNYVSEAMRFSVECNKSIDIDQSDISQFAKAMNNDSGPDRAVGDFDSNLDSSQAAGILVPDITSTKEGAKGETSRNGNQDFISTVDQAMSSNIHNYDPVTARVFPENGDLTLSVNDYHRTLDALKEAHIERFLASASWNVDNALEEFEKHPCKALNDAGILLPNTQDSDVKTVSHHTMTCLICCDDYSVTLSNWITLKGCQHAFCSECLGDYISDCARAKETGVSIDCPHHECSVPLDPDEVEVLSASLEIFESLFVAANENFIATANDLRFCPHPGCQGVVRKYIPQFLISKNLDQDLMDFCGATCTAVSIMDNGIEELTYEGVNDKNFTLTKNAVQPVKAHRFCYACGDTKVHWPVPCDTLEKWKEKIEKEIGQLGDNEDEERVGQGFEDVAQRLWLKANTRPCPNCKCPIEKDDGCNHMICSNRHCRHEFCWICREDWKLHNTETGGFFRCNRWQVDDKHQYYDTPPPVEQRIPEPSTLNDPLSPPQNINDGNHYGTALHNSLVAWKKAKEMGRFLHHFQRWTAHDESATLEKHMAETVCVRLAPVVEAALEFIGHDDFDFNGKGLSFVHSAFTELLESRSLLQHSYAFAFFRYPTFKELRRNRLTMNLEREKASFEQLQSELEMMTEQMSDIVARKHLRATQVQIMSLTNGACQKRSELSSLMLMLLHQQRKDIKDEMARGNEAHQQIQLPTVRRMHPSLPADAFGNQFGGVRLEGMPPRFNRSLEARYHRTAVDDDSDDSDDFLTRRARIDRDEESEVQQAIRASISAYRSHLEPMTGMRDTNTADWACQLCTYMNTGRHCAMCGVPRQSVLQS